MKFVMHGAAQEVGRSCIEVNTKGTRFLLDAGVKISPDIDYPTPIENLKGIDVVFISHAHLDHSGMLPMFDYQGLNCPIIGTAATRAITYELLIDSYEIDRLKKNRVVYQKADVRRIAQSIRIHGLNEWYKFKNIRFKLYDAGHIPGSTSVMVNADNKNILYTGDINTDPTLLLNQADTNYEEDVDVLIIDSTYGDRDHPDRKSTEDDFIATVREKFEKGSVLVPAFAVGRAQELMILLNKKKFGLPIYLDGMARRVTKDLFNYPDDVRDIGALKNSFHNLKEVHGMRERANIVKERAVFMTTSGMLDGGPVIEYLKHFHFDPDTSILLTGYQAEGSNGRNLLTSRHVKLDNQRVTVKSFVKQFDFSAHAGMTGLRNLIKKTNPKALILNHGDPPAIAALKEYAESIGIKAYAPKLNDKIDVR